MDMMQPAPQTQNPGDQMMERPEEKGFVVCIAVKPDGTFMVGRDDAQSGQPASDVKSALTIALQIIKSGGQDQGQDFAAGYEQTGGR